ncbi:mechanosensitive ion channel family protein [Novipirellula artificiosorum]|uniref:Small-conductance mechanosensitive channel n=1 Tax=Novipirellula artificiosorum TaxID=2528016 RepID=A0A5C6DD79_9BACT|nr:mechanosensitive ion channel family protein [Novipirellula artificiosorum]TWU33834.1 Small-conductance mechanosensitive channel [Novipirellula artificiosorum]
MQLDSDHPLSLRVIANRRRYRGAFLGFLIMGLAVSASAQDNAASNETSASQAAAAENAEGGETAQASESAGETGEEKKLDSPEAAESVVKQAAEDAKETTAEAVDALKSGDLTTAAKKSGELFTRYGIPAITVLVVLIVAFFVATFLARICSAPLKKGVDETLGKFVGKLVFYLVMVSALLGVLQYFGIGIASFAAVIAAAGFAIGLAFQGTLSNFSAGVMLLVFRPFKVGDVINAAGITAKVDEIDLFTTTFDTADNRRIIVPNSAIAGGIIENISHHQDRRVDIPVGVDYSADLKKTRNSLMAAAESQKEFLVEGEGRGYQIVLGELGDSSVGWTVRFWTSAGDYWTVKEYLTAAVKEHLDDANIGIPYPQMDVHLHQNEA